MQPIDPSQTRRLMLAVLLSLVILMGFEYIGPSLMPGKDAPKGQTVATQAATVPNVAAVSATAVNVVPHAEAVQLANGPVRAGLDPVGARVDQWVLTQYTVTHGDALGYPQLHPTGDHAEYVESGFVGAGIQAPGPETVWAVKQADQTHATLAWANATGQTFTRSVALQPDGFTLLVSDTVANAAALPVSVTPYAQVHRADGLFQGERASFVNHLGPMGVAMSDGKPVLHEANFADLKKNGASESVTGAGGWWGITGQYFMTAIVPLTDAAGTRGFRYTAGTPATEGHDIYTASVEGAAVVVPSGGSATNSYLLYAGPKQDSQLAKVGHNLDWAIDWGWFAVLAKPLYHVLLALHHYVGNWGVAIFLVTLMLKLVTFPLANKSYHSMAKMKKLQPRMEQLRERHGDDQQKLAMEMMALYRENKVNPLSGCWPMLIQIPIFFAMYKVVLLAFEFRHAPLTGLWIHDMSAADPYFILPLLMGVSMFVQQRLNPPPADPTQAQVFKFMPVMFTFMFLWFPAALVFYWLTNNLLSIAQQAYIMRKDKAI
jgi:YidC/Oxa1 family membrane protein insertase